jgi:peptide deformylase
VIRDIVLWPNPVLSRPCDPVAVIDDEIRHLADDMLETMYAAPGRGLAAPQVGVPLRLFVMDTIWKEGARAPRVLINPLVLRQSEDRVTGPEGCLSIPGVTAEVERAAEILMRWTTPEGETRDEVLTGFDAVCAQHELDHLDGIVTLDRVSPEARAELESVYAA